MWQLRYLVHLIISTTNLLTKVLLKQTIKKVIAYKKYLISVITKLVVYY